MILSKKQILERILSEGMVGQFVDLSTQIQSNGFDITVKNFLRFEEAGTIDFSNEERKIPAYSPFPPKKNCYHLSPGSYLINFNERLNIPEDLIALGYTRSSLLRMGAHIPSAVWDAGFEGYGQGLLIVTNPYGINVMERARVMQLVFIERTEDDSLYGGRWQDAGNK